MPVMPQWWDAAKGAQVEAFVASLGQVPPAMTLYHGTTEAFHKDVTGFNANEQIWIASYFQNNLGGTAHAGPGLYAAVALADAQKYGPFLMKTISSSLARSRYVDLTHSQVTGARSAARLSQQDVLRYAYKCVVKFTAEYYAVKDSRVEFEPN